MDDYLTALAKPNEAPPPVQQPQVHPAIAQYLSQMKEQPYEPPSQLSSLLQRLVPPVPTPSRPFLYSGVRG